MRPFLWVAAIAATPEGLEIGNFFGFLRRRHSLRGCVLIIPGRNLPAVLRAVRIFPQQVLFDHF